MLPLPEVGNNLQEHPMTSITYALNEYQTPIQSELSQCNEKDTYGGASGVSLMAFLPYSTLVCPSELERTISQVKGCLRFSL